MNLDEYSRLDATALADLVQTRQISPKELAGLALRSIELVNPDLGAVVETYDDRIEGLDERKLGSGPFRGVPFLIKDIGNHLEGRRFENCSRLCEGKVAAADTNYGAMLKASGVNIIGRTNTPEFSMSCSSENALYGATSTPWKKGYSAGGSSGGSAAAVSAGIVPMAHGSDIGGSIRGPSAWCGGIGLKPSRGQISLGPAIDERFFGLGMTFAQTISMRDTALMLDCLCRPQPGDPFVIQKPRSFCDSLKSSGSTWRIAWSAEPLTDSEVDSETAALVETIAHTLSDMGHHVEQAAPPIDLHAIDKACIAIWYYGFDQTLDGYAQATKRDVKLGVIEPGTMQIYEFSKSLSGSDVFAALDYLNKVRREVGTFFSTYDIWLTPTNAHMPAPHGEFGMHVDLPPGEFLAREQRAQQFQVIYNVTGQPAISLPLGNHSNGLPIGIQLGAGSSQDQLLIELGAVLETVMPWRDRVPPLHASNYA